MAYFGKEFVSKNMNLIIYSSFRNILLGAGMAFAIDQEKYSHIPVCIVFPSIYGGYQTYTNRRNILNFVKEIDIKITEQAPKLA
jgi:hypothetical protein